MAIVLVKSKKQKRRPYTVNVKKIRERLGLTQTEMAKKLGVSWISISRWENRHSRPQQSHKIVLRKARREARKVHQKTEATRKTQQVVELCLKFAIGIRRVLGRKVQPLREMLRQIQQV
jgi:DNA-binding XRE family transcriptional regulator